MPSYKITFGLAGAAKQNEIINFVKGNGGEVIQTSDGLCVKISNDLASFKNSLAEKNLLDGVSLQTTHPDDESHSPDVKTFLQG